MCFIIFPKYNDISEITNDIIKITIFPNNVIDVFFIPYVSPIPKRVYTT